MAVKTSKIGPGTLTLGETGTTIDISCQVTEAILSPDKDQDDNLNTLCGDVVPGDIVYTWALKGNLLQDLSPEGINKFCLDNAGVQMPFEFEPVSGGPTLSGMLVVDPIDIG